MASTLTKPPLPKKTTPPKEETKPKGYKRLPLAPDGTLLERRTWIHSPEDLVIVSWPKSGKTRSMMGVKGLLVGDADPDQGTKYFKGNNVANIRTQEGSEDFIQIKSTGAYIPSGLFYTVDELRNANNMKKYWELKLKLQERISLKEQEAVAKDLIDLIQSMPFPVFAVDTVTFLQDLNWDAALKGYNVRFNRQKVNIKLVDDWGGSQYIRNNMMGIKQFIDLNAAPFKIYTGHLKEKKNVIEKTDEEVSSVDMALEGQLSTIFTGKAQAVGIFNRNAKGCFLDFRKKGESDNGSRPEHIGNKLVKIAELDDVDKEGNIVQYGKTYWEKVYPELNF